MDATIDRRWAWLAAGGSVVLVVGAMLGAEIEARAGTQQCNTECQSKMTDCILACDGIRSCEETCKKKGQTCVAICTSDAGPSSLETSDAGADATLERNAPDARLLTVKDAASRGGRDR
jgi:hypothetical protein